MSPVDVINPSIPYFVDAAVRKFLKERFHLYLDAKYGKYDWPNELELADLSMFSGMSNSYDWAEAMGDQFDELVEMHFQITKDYNLDVRYQELKEIKWIQIEFDTSMKDSS